MYVDFENVEWLWTCHNSKPKPRDETDVPIEEFKKLLKPSEFDTFTGEPNWIVEMLKWNYYSDYGWILGYAVQLTVGLFAYTYISTETLVQFIQAIQTDQYAAFFMGPMRRTVSGWTIYWINVFFTAVPGLNFAAPFFMVDWAEADYYNYYTRIVPLPQEEVD